MEYCEPVVPFLQLFSIYINDVKEGAVCKVSKAVIRKL